METKHRKKDNKKSMSTIDERKEVREALDEEVSH